MSITVKDLTKRFGRFTALDHVSLEVPGGSLVALLGPSGSGKTTLLRIIAGLEVADSGTVCYSGEDVTRQSARDRNIGFVFQHYALFRHLNVFENIAFGLRVRRWPKARIAERVGELLRLVRLEGLEGRHPSELSGGQRQRVALARALAAQPRLLLLDEPFGALDAKVRQELRQWLRRLHEEIHMTSVFVTHDQEEAFEVADKVVVMRAGQVEQSGTPQEVFEHPANPFVMDFLGNVNVFHGRAQNGRVHVGDMEVAYPEYPHQEARPATAYVRPHELDISAISEGPGSLAARVLHVNPNGSVAKVQLLAAETNLALQVDLSLSRYAELGLKAGDAVYVCPRRVRVFLPEDYSI
ncbi:MAG TPA: sulfate/molybdate ABC transporter ATP-binding protein [Gemmataceae bacterium]|jgi:sulfate transport system ATP-binding protein|nr:sulfate/molybdate ABC transporter ATP-binding protein [Gemmataceae bacterium]